MNWYCLHTKPKRELHAIEHLSGQLGFEVFFPKLRRRKTIRRVRREITEPLFPRYVFCRFDLTTSYRAVRYANDVLDVLSFGPVPAPVDDRLVDELKHWASAAGETIRAGSAFSSGDRVKVSDGPMQGLHAVILEDKNESDRVDVLLWILGCGARLTISRHELVKIA